MKSLAELAELRKKSLDAINMRDGQSHKRVVVGMATCGNRCRQCEDDR